MNKQIVLHLTPKHKLEFDLSVFKIRPGFAAIFDIVNLIGILLWLAFPILFFSSDLFYSGSGVGSLVFVYFFAGVMLALQLFKKFMTKGDFLPQVPHDILLLLFTTLIAISLFFSTVIFKKGYDIWGGSSLRTISGISIIAYWFIYYLLISNFNSKKILDKFSYLLWSVSPLVAVVVSVIMYNVVAPGLAAVMVLLIPAFLILFLTQAKGRWLYLINLVLGVILISTIQQKQILLVPIFFFMIAACGLLLVNRRSLPKFIVKLDDTTDELLRKKIGFVDYLEKNKAFLYLIISLLVSVIGLGWLIGYANLNLFDFFTASLKTFSPLPPILNLFFGDGLTSTSPLKLVQFFHAYGFIAFAAISSVIVLIIKGLFDLRKHEDKQVRAWAFVLLSIIMCLGLGMVFSPLPDIAVTLLPLVLATAAILKLQYADNQHYKLSNVLIDFKNIKQENYRYLLRFIQICVLISIAIILIYFFNVISVIESYLR